MVKTGKRKAIRFIKKASTIREEAAKALEKFDRTLNQYQHLLKFYKNKVKHQQDEMNVLKQSLLVNKSHLRMVKIENNVMRNKLTQISLYQQMCDNNNILLNVTEQTLKVKRKGIEVELVKNYNCQDYGYCYICLNDNKQIVLFKCGHGLCCDCFIIRGDNVLNKSNNCYVCKQEIN